MTMTFREQLSNAFWWLIALGITAYLFWGAYNTITVILA
jgi:hypothetical protein